VIFDQRNEQFVFFQLPEYQLIANSKIEPVQEAQKRHFLFKQYIYSQDFFQFFFFKNQ